MQWYCAVNGQQMGPVDQDGLMALARDGKLKPDDLVWNSSMGQQWAKASTIPGLFQQAGAPPAPGTPPSVNQWAKDTTFTSQTHNRDLMAAARAALSGNWGLAIGGVAVYMGLCIVMAIIPYLGNVISFVIGGPLMLGWTLFFLALSRRQSADVGMIFSGFKNFGTGFLANLFITLLILAWMLPAIFMIIVTVAVGVKGSFHGGMPDVGLIALLVVLTAAATVPALIAQFRYAMTYYIINDKPEINALDAIRQSTQMMRGNKFKLLCLQFRFIGWSLLCVLTLFIGFLWLIPYMMTSTAAFYDDLKEGQKG